jgi:hypothetical protein
VSPGGRERPMPLGNRRILLLAPGPAVGGRPESSEEQLEAWEGVIATARAVFAAGGSVEVEGDPYAGLLVGLVAGEFLERAPAEGERSEPTAARPESPRTARVIVRTVRGQDETIQEGLRGLSESGIVRLETGLERETSMPLDAVVAFGDAAANASFDLVRQRAGNALRITIPLTAAARQRRSDFDSPEGRGVLEAAEEAVDAARTQWRERRASDRERGNPPEELGFADDRWTERIPHGLYAQILVERLERSQ